MRALLFSGLALALAQGCATAGHVQDEYEEEVIETGRARTSGRTVVLFLVDGLGEQALSGALRRNDVPNLRRHFLSQPGARIARAKTVFSSSTFPGIASILSTSPVSRHGIVSNKIFELEDGELEETNFENVLSRKPLRRRLEPESVFTRLSARGLGSVSLSQPFRAGASAYYPNRVLDGIYYANHSYSGIDFQVIESLEKLLLRTPTQEWPAFVFVHLIGYDSLAHEEGFDSRAARRYLARLDERLEGALALLRDGEAKGREVVSLLTADHGFMNRERTVDMKRVLKRLTPRADAIIEGRIAQLRFPEAQRDVSRAPVLKALAAQDGVALAAAREGNSIYVIRKGAAERIDFADGTCAKHPYRIRVTDLRRGESRFYAGFCCPEELDRHELEREGGYAYASLADFFQADSSPDMVVVAAAGVTFTSGYRGNHGGLTREEMIVPLLSRNAAIASGNRFFANTGLLDFLFDGSLERSVIAVAP